MLRLLIMIFSVVIVTLSGAYFSICGLVSMFSAAPFAVGIMAAGLELSKFTAAAHLHERWTKISKIARFYLSSAIIILSMITSIGIYGFLSNAYQKASLDFQSNNFHLEQIEDEQSNIKEEIKRLTNSKISLPDSWISKRMQIQKSLDSRISDLREKERMNISKLAEIKNKGLTVSSKVGPLMFFAKALNVSLDVVAKWLILSIIFVFDPLAICMVIALVVEFNELKKEKNDIIPQKEEPQEPQEPKLELQTLNQLKPEIIPSARRTYSTEDKERIIQEFKTSGISLSKFATEKQISKSILHSWLKKVE